MMLLDFPGNVACGELPGHANNTLPQVPSDESGDTMLGVPVQGGQSPRLKKRLECKGAEAISFFGVGWYAVGFETPFLLTRVLVNPSIGRSKQ